VSPSPAAPGLIGRRLGPQVAEPGFQPIARSPLYEQVAQRLREFIATENLQPGDRLMSERDLAERLGVSRTSLRQELTALRVMGVVEVRHGDGIFLLQPSRPVVPTLAPSTTVSHEEHLLFWEVRAGIAAQAARLAARRRTDDQLAGMRASVEAMSRSIARGADAIDDERGFLRAIAAAAHNPVLEALLEQVVDVLDRAAAPAAAGRSPDSVALEIHRDILAAIEARDGDAADRAMRAHVEASARGATDPSAPAHPDGGREGDRAAR